MGLREDLLATDDRDTKEVYCEKLKNPDGTRGRKLWIISLNGTDRDFITNLYMQADGLQALPPRIHEHVIVRGVVVDAEGARAFKDEDVEVIAERWGETIKFLSDQILDFSGMAPNNVDDAAKNSSGDLNAASGSGSPSPSDTL